MLPGAVLGRLVITVPDTAIAASFHNRITAANTNRTILFLELRLLLSACPPETSRDEYRGAIVDENALLKATATTRRDSFRYPRAR